MNALVRLTDRWGGAVYVAPAQVAAWWGEGDINPPMNVTRLTLNSGQELVVSETPDEVTAAFTEAP